MAPTGTANASSIARALAGMTEPVPTAPKPQGGDSDLWAGRDSFATVAARSAPTKPVGAVGLPTPPNSISPSLPPQAFKSARPRVANDPPTPPGPAHFDSDIDIDLEDAVEHAQAQDSPQRGLTARRLGDLAHLDAVGTITPSLLAKHHLPGILLDHGPLAIRHVMGYLTTSVPGFSGIPPAKARRLVVGALEGRGGEEGARGGVDGDVLFEKVGWGRWDARKRGQASSGGQRRPSQPSGGLRIPIQSVRGSRGRVGEGIYGSHQDSDHAYDTPMEDVSGSVLEHEADQMSLDNGSTCSSRGAPVPQSRRRQPPDMDMGDVTDEEDWASIGAAALRQGSFPLTGGIMPAMSRSQGHQQPVEPKSRGRGTAQHQQHQQQQHRNVGLANSMPATSGNQVKDKENNVHYWDRKDGSTGVHGSATTAGTGTGQGERAYDAQDREAVEALLKLSSF